jgi:hypothetical protein
VNSVGSLIRTPFGFRSTAAVVVAGIDLTGKRAVVTGASSGIGIETARALAGAPALRSRWPFATRTPARRRRTTSRRRPAGTT